jgi:putative DNA primase/helicase
MNLPATAPTLGSDIDRAKKTPVVDVCRHLLPDGRLEREEWVATNPTRSDETPGSFKINIVTGRFSDFADPGRGGNDVVALWRYVRQSGSMLQAARELLSEMDGFVPTPPNPAHDRPRVAMAIMPVPDDARQLSSADVQNIFQGPRNELDVWRYLDQNNRLLGFTCILPASEGRPRKQVLQHCYCEMSDGLKKWTWGGPQGEQARPLFRLEHLGSASKVILVEGERKAHLGQTFFPTSTAVLGWWGGSNSAQYVDLKPLSGKTVILFPDHDAQKNASGELRPYDTQPGVKAMHTIGRRLLELGCTVWMVDYSMGEMPSGWDLGDAFDEGWTREQVQNYIMSHRRDFSKPSATPPSNKETRDALWNTKKPYQNINPEEFPFVLSTEKTARIFDMWQNIDRMLHIYGISIRYNLMTKESECSFGDATAADQIYSMCNNLRIPVKGLDKHLNVICRQHSFHPVKHWIDSAKWDGVNRIEAIVETIECQPMMKIMARQLLIRWMVSAIALVYRERMGARGTDPSAHGVLTFAGKGGGGKTSWIQTLAPGNMVTTGSTVQVGNKDSEIIVLKSWITELGELGATFRKSDMDNIKSWLTRSSDTIRVPYGRVFEKMARQTVFASSVNDHDFLVDKTGNRRWWVIQADRLHYDHDVNMQQLWAQILVMYRAGEQWHLNPDEFEALEMSNANHMQPSPIEHILLSGLDWNRHVGLGEWSWRTAGDVLRLVTRGKPSIGECRDAGAWLRDYGCKNKVSGRNTLFYVPIGAGST